MTEATIQVEIINPETEFGGVIIVPPAPQTSNGSGPPIIVSGDVSSVFARKGDVVAQPDDYAAFYMPLGSLPSGPFYYWNQIKNLTGGAPSTDLDAQPIDLLPTDALIQVVIPDRGGSQWLRVHDTTAFGTPSAPDIGIIVPTTYDASLKPWILLRQLGY